MKILLSDISGELAVRSRALKVKGQFDDDQWLGSLHSFPTVLHARGSISFDISPASLQKALVSAMSSLGESQISTKITVADQDGYSNGSAHFKIGVGNGEGFDILDAKEAGRILDRIENRGAFDSLDLAVHIHYSIDDGRRHKIHQDRYVIRLIFQPGRVDALIHHLKGIRRVDAAELIGLIIAKLNNVLSREKFPEVYFDLVTLT